MSDTPAESKKAVDPLEPWRELRDAYIDAWAKATCEAVQSEEYAQASGAMLETVLSTSAPFREVQKKLMVSALEQLNMPSRADFVSLAERLANLELLLDDMDAKLTQIAASMATQHAPKSEPETKPQQAPSDNADMNDVGQPAPRVEPEMKSPASRKAARAPQKGPR